MVEKAKVIFKKIKHAKVKNNEDYFFVEIARTNLLLAKNKENKVGFIIYNDKKINENRFYLENFSYKFISQLQSPKKSKNFNNCSIIFANQLIEDEFFVSIMVSLFSQEEIMKVTTELLLKKIDEVIKIFNYSATNKEELIGLWGELFLINHLILINKSDSSIINEIIDGWEGENTRANIDFKFKDLKVAFEVKTTKSIKRIHHINGFEQINIPNGINKYYFISFTVNENGNKSCFDLYSSILKNANTIGNRKLFENKCYLRGIKLCLNKNYKLNLSCTIDNSIYDVNDIPRPKQTDGVLDLRWSVDFNRLVPFKTKKKNYFNSLFD
jgi:hypothetical protein